MFEDQSCVLKHLNHLASWCAHFATSTPAVQQASAPVPMVVDDLTNYASDQMETENEAGFDSGEIEEVFNGAAQILGADKTFMDQFNADPHAVHRQDNLYYPFTSREEWELASFLLRSGMAMSSIDEFLALGLIRLFFI
jgi:hypothetical protein